jgi:hypothetical protein
MSRSGINEIIALLESGQLVKGRLQGQFFIRHADGQITDLDQKIVAGMVECGQINYSGRRDEALNQIYCLAN